MAAERRQVTLAAQEDGPKVNKIPLISPKALMREFALVQGVHFIIFSHFRNCLPAQMFLHADAQSNGCFQRDSGDSTHGGPTDSVVAGI